MLPSLLIPQARLGRQQQHNQQDDPAGLPQVFNQREYDSVYEVAERNRGRAGPNPCPPPARVFEHMMADKEPSEYKPEHVGDTHSSCYWGVKRWLLWSNTSGRLLSMMPFAQRNSQGLHDVCIPKQHSGLHNAESLSLQDTHKEQTADGRICMPCWPGFN
jgi:hypothetical protein